MFGFDDFMPSKWFDGILSVHSKSNPLKDAKNHLKKAAIISAFFATSLNSGFATEMVHFETNSPNYDGVSIQKIEPSIAELKAIRASRQSFMEQIRNGTLSHDSFKSEFSIAAKNAVERLLTEV